MCQLKKLTMKLLFLKGGAQGIKQRIKDLQNEKAKLTYQDKFSVWKDVLYKGKNIKWQVIPLFHQVCYF